MTKAQKLIIFRWFCCVALLIALLIFNDWIINQGNVFSFLLFAIGTIIVTLNKHDINNTDRKDEMNKIIDENPWIKLYFFIYGILVLIGVIYININIIVFENPPIVGGFILVLMALLPVVIIQQKRAYIAAGE